MQTRRSTVHPGFARILAKARAGGRITEADFTSGAVVFTRADLEELEAITGRCFSAGVHALEQSAEDETAELLERLRAFRLE